MHKLWMAIGLIAASAASVDSHAQDAAVEPAAPEPALSQCELHVWPAAEIKSVTQGWWWNHTVNQAFDPAKGGLERPKVLAPERQRDLLGALDLPQLLQLPPSAVTIHIDPLPRTASATKARLSGSSSSCYAELIVSQNFYDAAPMAPKSLRSLLVLRRFGDAIESPSSFSTWADTSLAIYPAKTADQAQAADREIGTAYAANVRIFAGYATRPPKKKKK
jgi:hypothetical protein